MNSLINPLVSHVVYASIGITPRGHGVVRRRLMKVTEIGMMPKPRKPGVGLVHHHTWTRACRCLNSTVVVTWSCSFIDSTCYRNFTAGIDVSSYSACSNVFEETHNAC